MPTATPCRVIRALILTGGYDYYAVIVPTNNAGLLRTELQAISGNPNLYLRAGVAPSLNHYSADSCDCWDGTA